MTNVDLVSFNKSQSYQLNSDMNKISRQLREAYAMSSQLKQHERIIVVKTYLCYLLYELDATVNSISELQVLAYQISKVIDIEYHRGSETLVKKFSKSMGPNIVESAVKLPAFRKKVSDVSEPLEYKNIMVKQLLLLKDKSMYPIFKNCEAEQALVSRIETYSDRSDRALEYAVHAMIERLLSVVDANTQMNTSIRFIDKAMSFLNYRVQSVTIDKYRIIARYHKKGLFVNDCKRIYKQQMMKYLRVTNNG